MLPQLSKIVGLNVFKKKRRMEKAEFEWGNMEKNLEGKSDLKSCRKFSIKLSGTLKHHFNIKHLKRKKYF
jgi:hypothetical protein